MGSNLGSREAYLRGAVEHLRAFADLEILEVSSVYRTAPVGPEQPWYLNAAVRVQSALSPPALLEALLEVERAFGRRRAERWGPRVLDLDLLWAEGVRVESPELSVPHPELLNRAFALAPLVEVCPTADPHYALRLAEIGGPPAESQPFSGQSQGEASEGWAWGRDEADALAAALTLSFGGGAIGGMGWERHEWNFEWGALSVLAQEVRNVVEGGFWPHHFVVGPAQNTNPLVGFGSIETDPLPSLGWKSMELRTRGVGVESRLLLAPP